MKSTNFRIAQGLLLSLAIVACADSTKTGANGTSSSAPTPAATREERLEARRKVTDEKAVTRVSKNASPATTGEVPDDVMDKILADLEKRTAADQSEFTVTRAEAVSWNDGSLGCSEPGQNYTMATVTGFRIVIEHQGKPYDYRVSERGFFKLCADPRSAIDRLRDEEKGPRNGAPDR